MFNFDPETLFSIEVPIAELFLRGTIIYLGILLLMRVLLRRIGGELAMMDLVFIILIAEAATHSFGGYESVSEGFIVILTLVGWNFAVNWLSFHFPFIEKLVSARSIQIVKDGKLLRRNMRREYITQEELLESLHREGIDDISKVKAAFVEGDGAITFVKKD
ncbi:hypothetical protein CO230_09000 [Chryseobacterium sp. 6424]|uniref:DUF421 domain-containing protein n=1 Tax=Chryseobacterium sp. 6424 TaxID=2039166 RepID=UPI000EFCD7B1|nr:YetF domain-containing protein [Chryseobacterium sp. 6424]AYO58249.1 hypothetical protein CO230_09000 [Chryseobacterium sp. 6424]